MYLIKFINHEPIVTEETLLVPKFKAIHTEYKEESVKIFTYIFFMYGYLSDFNDIVDVDERRRTVINEVFNGEDIEECEIMKPAIELFKLLQDTPSMRLIYSGRVAMHKVEAFLNNVDLTEMDKNGKPMYSPKMIADIVGNLHKITLALSELEAQVKRELDESSRIRGGGELNPLEVPDDEH